MQDSKPDYRKALLELGILFLPALPAYFWLWPNIEAETSTATFVQSAVYVYLLAGTLFIGLRRWNGRQLGVSITGIRLSLACGAVLIVTILIGRSALDIPLLWGLTTLPELAGAIVFYVVFVGIAEELLFRGLLYRLLQDWGGTVLALGGSTIAFTLYHIGWANALQMAAIALVGFIFGLVRWRSGGVLGLILVHGAYDIISTGLNRGAPIGSVSIGSVVKPELALLSDMLLFALVVYLIWVHPKLAHGSAQKS